MSTIEVILVRKFGVTVLFQAGQMIEICMWLQQSINFQAQVNALLLVLDEYLSEYTAQSVSLYFLHPKVYLILRCSQYLVSCVYL